MCSKGHWGHRPPWCAPEAGHILHWTGKNSEVSERRDWAPSSLLQVFPGLQWVRGSQNLQSGLEVTRKSQLVQDIPKRREVEIGQSVTGGRNWRKTSSGMCPAECKWINEMVTCVELGTRVNHCGVKGREELNWNLVWKHLVLIDHWRQAVQIIIYQAKKGNTESVSGRFTGGQRWHLF